MIAEDIRALTDLLPPSTAKTRPDDYYTAPTTRTEDVLHSAIMALAEDNDRLRERLETLEQRFDAVDLLISISKQNKQPKTYEEILSAAADIALLPRP